MAKISLRMYNREIEGLVEQQRLEEAIAHCRHILKSFPKHLETYRLLGKAYLEAKRYDQAVDIFQRVLVAAPEDFVAHVGMSIISDDKGRLDDAIWHMERAFEVQPSNAAIQGELQRLFGRRDGVEPPKIRLTRGALAHMYVQGELYNQAISEIRAVLANDSKRTDMQTLLARAYFLNGQRAEATEICNELIARYQYCLDANRLMAEIVPGTPHPEAAQDYRDRVIELDPYAAFTQDTLFHSDAVADGVVTLERLEYTAEMGEMPPTLGIRLEPEAPSGGLTSAAPPAPRPPAAASDLPAWLSAVAEAPASHEAPPAAPPPAPSLPKDDIPEFLRQAGWGTSSGAAAPETPSSFERDTTPAPSEKAAVEGDLPEWVKALAPTEEAPAATTPPSAFEEGSALPADESPFGSAFAADTPDWLRSLGPAEPEQPPAPAPESSFPAEQTPPVPADVPDWLRDLGPAPSTAAAQAGTPEETPDWLKNLEGRELDEPAAASTTAGESDWLGDLRAEQAAAAPETPAEESPDWLKEFSNDLETPLPKAEPAAPPSPPPVAAPPAAGLGLLGTSAQEQDDAMAWLEGLAAKHGAKPEELVTDPNARTEVAPEWVDKAREIGEPAEPSTPAPAEDETGIWLRGMETATGAVTAPLREPEEPEEEKPFDFAGGLAERGSFAGAEPEKEEPPVMGEAETPSWMSGLASKPAEGTGMEDAPDWLRGISRETEEPEQPAVTPSVHAQVPTQPPQPVETPEPAGETTDLPAWLAGLDNEQPPMAAPELAGEPSEALPSWLQAEIEPEPEAKEPAKPTDWHPVEAKPVEPPSRPEPVAEPKPVAEKPIPPPPAPVVEHFEEQLPPVPPPAPRPEMPAAPAATPAPTRPKAAPAVRLAAVSLSDAQAQLGRGNITGALDLYGRLIRKGKSLEEIIRDLRDALYRYPVEVPLWQSLGDAYMRANRLQEALDAYTKAEELLR